MLVKTNFDPIDLFLNLNSTFLLFLVKCFFGCFCLFKRYFYSARGHGKSPCFSQDAFLQSISPDCLLPMLPFADGAENME